MKSFMKKISSIIVICIMLFSVSMTSYAQTEEWGKGTDIKTIRNVKEYVNANGARITSVTRGMLISSVEISLVNLGNGVAEIYADELCHEPMKKIKMVLYLEKWDESIEDWNQEERFPFEWNAEDDPDDELSMASVSFNVYGLERGYKYRVRALFGAYALNSGYQEVWQAWTTDVYFD